jgi:hypothetical protein
MALPQNVKKQAARAEEIMREQAAARNTQQPAPGAQDPAPQPVVVQPAQPAAPQPNADLDAAKKDAESWRQRYLVLQGKYDKEVPALGRQVAELTDKVKELSFNLEQKPAVAPVSDEDRERFGADMIDVVTRVATSIATETVKPLKDQLGTVKATAETVAQETARSAEQQFWGAFDKLLADKGLAFDPINNDAGFIKWLGEKDVFSGMTRQQLLDKAIQDMDASRAAMFFITYSSGLPKGGAAPLEQHIQPDNTVSGTDPLETPKGKVWTRTEIAKFHDDVRRGLYRGKDAERRGTEADIAAAYRENRIR